MLVTVASKVLCKIVLDRMKDALDERRRDEQAGFRKERSCCGQIAKMEDHNRADPGVKHWAIYGFRGL